MCASDVDTRAFRLCVNLTEAIVPLLMFSSDDLLAAPKQSSMWYYDPINLHKSLAAPN